MDHCEEYLELISASLDGALSPADQQRLAHHLAQCPQCRALELELRAIHRTMADLPAPAPPADLKDKVLAAVAADHVIPLPVKKPSPWKRWGALAAAAALAVTGAWLGMGRGGLKSESMAPTAEISSVQAKTASMEAAAQQTDALSPDVQPSQAVLGSLEPREAAPSAAGAIPAPAMAPPPQPDAAEIEAESRVGGSLSTEDLSLPENTLLNGLPPLTDAIPVEEAPLTGSDPDPSSMLQLQLTATDQPDLPTHWEGVADDTLPRGEADSTAPEKAPAPEIETTEVEVTESATAIEATEVEVTEPAAEAEATEPVLVPHLVAVIRLDGSVVGLIDLSRVTETQTLEFTGASGHTNTVEVAPGRIRVLEATCPDQICVSQGWLDEEWSILPIACLPNCFTIEVCTLQLPEDP